MNKIEKKFLLVAKNSFTYSACGPCIKNKEAKILCKQEIQI